MFKLTYVSWQGKWTLARISGSHHIFTKQGRRSLPVALHGGDMGWLSVHTARLLRKQAGLRDVAEEVYELEPTVEDDDLAAITDDLCADVDELSVEENPRRGIRAREEAKRGERLEAAELAAAAKMKEVLGVGLGLRVRVRAYSVVTGQRRYCCITCAD